MRYLKRKEFYQVLGPLLFLLMEIMGPPPSMNILAYHVLAATTWIAVWWVTEAIPIAVTSLLPIVLFPLTGALDIASTTSAFGHKYIFLYIGGFLIAIAIEKWGLHKRIALTIIRMIGTNLQRIILGFMLATAFLSMWISNTATSVMMLPIGMAVISQFGSSDSKESGVIGKSLMLGIAYSASIGGFATLIGTPPNLVLASVLDEFYGIKLSFFDWMKFGLPVSFLLLLICWRYLTTRAFRMKGLVFPGGKAKITEMLKELGPMKPEEKRVLILFIATAVAWMTRSLIQKVIPFLDDTIIAMIAATVLFIIPASSKGGGLIQWKDSKELPWGIVLLFGGGLALARGFTSTGLSEWIAAQMGNLQGLHLLLIILFVVAVINFLTEFTSNLATTAMFLPVLAPIALSLDVHPYLLMVSAAIAASCAFMLPVATPPNAVVFGSGHLKISDMIKTGIWMNLISILLVALLSYYLLPVFWSFMPEAFPEELK